MRNVSRLAKYIGLANVIGLGMIGGCAPNSTAATQPAAQGMYERQQQAMKHPLEYSPFQENPDISGGGIGDFDAKAFGKELHDFFNP